MIKFIADKIVQTELSEHDNYSKIRLNAMKLNKCSAFFAAITLAAAPFSVGAQVATSNLDVRITIAADCQITATDAIDFGSTGVLNSTVDASGTISVACTDTTPFVIGLDEGTGSGASTTTRYMTAGTGTIAYQLFRDAAHSNIWGNTPGADTQAGTGSGTVQTFPVYGRVSAQTTPAPGTYNDVVTVSVTY